MDDEKRLVAFLVMMMLVIMITPQLSQWIWGPPPQRARVAKPEQKGADAEGKRDVDKRAAEEPAQAKQAEPPAAGQAAQAGAPEPGKKDREAPLAAEEPPPLETRALGSADPASGFKMKVQLTNLGAAVQRIELADYLSEFRTGPLKLIDVSDDQDGSFLLGLKGTKTPLENRTWKIVEAPAEKDPSAESASFQTVVPEQGLVLTKTFTLRQGSYNLGLEIEVANRSGEPRQVAYRLGGPRGSALEGAWYAAKKRDAAIADGLGAGLKNNTIQASTLVKGADEILELKDVSDVIRKEKWNLRPEWFDRFDLDQNGKLTGEEVTAAANHLAGGERNRWVERPVRFAGVDGQFFCTLLLVPPPKSPEDRWDATTVPVLVHRDRRHPDRSDVSVELESQTFDVRPDQPLQHAYTIYAGPRRRDILEESLGDSALAQSIINYQGFLFIFPASLVSLTANIMLFLLQIFHGWVGNWGVGIIMLTVMVRLMMFPLSRKQALSVVKMQTIKPELDALKEKYKNEKEKFARAQMELMRKHGVSPLGGCLPLLLQMPIFIGLWQSLQSSVDLRQARFLWIDNLAAPDGPSVPFFEWGENIPLVSRFLGPYFNLLPCALIALMLVQQKMFMPPKANPPDPQTEMQQKMMTYMMVVFGAIFWRLPSGLCVYYIASTLWGIAERQLLPKLQHAPAPAVVEKKGAQPGERKGKGGPDRDGRGPGKKGRGSAESNAPTWAERLLELLKPLSELLKRANKR